MDDEGRMIKKALASGLARVVPPKGDVAEALRRGQHHARNRRASSLFAALCLTFVSLALVVALLHSFSTNSDVATSTSSAILEFSGLPESFFVASSNGSVENEYGDIVGAPTAWASTVPFSEADSRTPWNDPEETIASLPKDGVVVVTRWVRPSASPSPTPDFPERSLPLDFGEFTGPQTWEGQPRADMTRFHLGAFIDDGYLEVDAYFGTPDPSQDVLSLASQAVSSLQLNAPPPSAVPDGQP